MTVAAEYMNPDLAHAVIAWMIGLPIFIAVVWAVMVWPERERWTKPAPVVVEPAKPEPAKPEPVKPSTTLTYCQCCDGLKYEWRMDWYYGAYRCDRCRGVPVLSVKQKAKQVGISR